MSISPANSFAVFQQSRIQEILLVCRSYRSGASIGSQELLLSVLLGASSVENRSQIFYLCSSSYQKKYATTGALAATEAPVTTEGTTIPRASATTEAQNYDGFAKQPLILFLNLWRSCSEAPVMILLLLELCIFYHFCSTSTKKNPLCKMRLLHKCRS